MSWLQCHFNYDVYIVKRMERYLRLFHSQNKIRKTIGKCLFNRTKRICSCNIYPTVDIGKNIYIAHPTSITVGDTSVLGNNIIIYPGVQLISNFASDRNVEGRRHPKVEDGCILCATSIVIGSVTVGQNSIIAAGAIVTRDVPPNTIVTGINVHHENKYLNKEFIQKTCRSTNREKIMFLDETMLF